MIEATFVCYFCEDTITTNRHSCERECHIEGMKVIHRDFCKACQKILIASFFRQKRNPQLRLEKKKLRTPPMWTRRNLFLGVLALNEAYIITLS